MSEEKTPDITTVTDVANTIASATRAAITIYDNGHEHPALRESDSAVSLSTELGFELLRILENDSTLDVLPMSLPISRSWFPEGYDFAGAVTEALARDGRKWLIDDNPGLLEQYLMPVFYKKGIFPND